MNRNIVVYNKNGEGIQFIKYNAIGQIIKKVDGLRFNNTLEESTGTVYEYDGLGNNTKVTDSMNCTAVFEYDVKGRLIKNQDPNSNVTLYEYNADDTVNKITYNDLSFKLFEYDCLGRKTSEQNQNGSITKYEYNSFNQISSIENALQNKIQYKYDLKGNAVKYIDETNIAKIYNYDSLDRIKEIKTPLEYDLNNNILYSIEKYEYDSAGNIIKETKTGTKDLLNKRVMEYEYYNNNLLKKTTYNEIATTEYDYDLNKNNILIKSKRNSSNYDIRKFEYDIENRMTRNISLIDESIIYNPQSIPNIVTLRDSEFAGFIQSITEYEYDKIGNKVSETIPQGFNYIDTDIESRDKYKTIYTYDSLNRLIKKTVKYGEADTFEEYGYDNNGNKTSHKDRKGFITNYTYDYGNRLTSVVDANNNTFSIEFDLAGNKIKETNESGNSVDYTYDVLNRLKTVKNPDGDVISTYNYDEKGNAIEFIDAKGYKKEYKYNLANMQTEIRNQIAIDTGDTNQFTTKIEYNQYGDAIKEIDALGNSTLYEYDDFGNITEVINAKNISTKYFYDYAGNKTKTIDGNNKITNYEYGAFGLIRKAIDPEGLFHEYKYNLNKSKVYTKDKNLNTVLDIYNNLGLLTDKLVIETGDNISYQYDKNNNLAVMIDESGTYDYTYDNLNRLIEIQKSGIMQIQYTYDDIGNIETVTDLKNNITAYTYDNNSRMKTVTSNGNTTTYNYDLNGNRQSVVYESGVKEEYIYNKINRITQLTNRKNDNTVISEFNYAYDLNGNQIQVVHSLGTTNYQYNELGQLILEEFPGKTISYAYDNVGNRISMNETYLSEQPTGFVDEINNISINYFIKNSQYFYSDSNKLLKVIEVIKNSSFEEVLCKTDTYINDGNGNQLRQITGYKVPQDSNMRRYTRGIVYGSDDNTQIDILVDKKYNTFDGFNRLTKSENVSNGNRTIVSYKYNGKGLRTQKTSRSSENNYQMSTINYLYDRQYVILETNENTDTLTRYVKGINYISRITATGTESNYLFNAHGDIVQIVSSTGTVENNYSYDSFGNTALEVEQYHNAIRYSGEFFDKETGLYYLRARYYNPGLGRFISEDSYWGEDKNPLSANLYTYTENNPTRFIDPSGHNKTEVEKIHRSITRTIDMIETRKEKLANLEVGSRKYNRLQNEISNLKQDLLEYETQLSDLNDESDYYEIESEKEFLEENIIDVSNDAGYWEEYIFNHYARKLRYKRGYSEKELGNLKGCYYRMAVAYGTGENEAAIDYSQLTYWDDITEQEAEDGFNYEVAALNIEIEELKIQDQVMYEAYIMLKELRTYKKKIDAAKSRYYGWFGNQKDYDDWMEYQSYSNNLMELLVFNKFIQSDKKLISKLMTRIDTKRESDLLSQGYIKRKIKEMFTDDEEASRIIKKTEKEIEKQKRREFLSFVANFVPILGTIKDISEAVTGTEWFTGDELTTGERILSGLGAAVDVIGGGLATDLLKVSKKGRKALRVTDIVDSAADISRRTSVFSKIRKAFRSSNKIGGVTFEGKIYRNVNSAYDPLEMNQYIIEAMHRFSGVGTPGVYFSSSERLVYKELENHGIFDFTNRRTYSYNVKMDNMLDLSDPNVRSQLGIELNDIIGDDYTITNIIGDYAYENGYNGIIAPSARADGGVNIVVFDTKNIE
jgi:RHS repeat-associated protein